jgi:hypothetical protein
VRRPNTPALAESRPEITRMISRIQAPCETLGGHFGSFTGFLLGLSFQLLVLGTWYLVLGTWVSLTVAGLCLINDLVGFSLGLVAAGLDQIDQCFAIGSIPSLVTLDFDIVHQPTQLVVGLLRILGAALGSVLIILLSSLGFLLDVVRVELGFASLTHGQFDLTLDILQVEVDTLCA